MKNIKLITRNQMITKIMLKPYTMLKRIDLETDRINNIIKTYKTFKTPPTAYALFERDDTGNENVYLIKHEKEGKNLVRFFRTDKARKEFELNYIKYIKRYNEEKYKIREDKEEFKSKAFEHWTYIEDEEVIYNLEDLFEIQAKSLIKDDLSV